VRRTRAASDEVSWTCGRPLGASCRELDRRFTRNPRRCAPMALPPLLPLKKCIESRTHTTNTYDLNADLDHVRAVGISPATHLDRDQKLKETGRTADRVRCTGRFSPHVPTDRPCQQGAAVASVLGVSRDAPHRVGQPRRNSPPTRFAGDARVAAGAPRVAAETNPAGRPTQEILASGVTERSCVFLGKLRYRRTAGPRRRSYYRAKHAWGARLPVFWRTLLGNAYLESPGDPWQCPDWGGHPGW
jgi:hypothetical protein